MKGNVINLNTLHLNSVRLNGIGKVQSVSLKGGSTEDPVFPPVEPPIEPEPTPTYTLSASVTNGKVSAKRNGSAVNLPFTANEGDTIVLEVTPNDGYSFEGWNDGVKDNPRTITMNADVALSAQCVEVVQPPVGNYIQFEDPAVEAICVANWSSDGIGLTEEDAASVTTIGTTFKGNTEITSFDEFKYFTGVTEIKANAFKSCTALASINLDNVTNIGIEAFYASGVKELNAPMLSTLGRDAFMNSKLERIVSLGSITAFPSALSGNYGLFRNCPLKEVALPEALEAISSNSFTGVTSVNTMNLPSSLKTISSLPKGTWADGMTVSLPNLTSVGQVFRGLGVKRVENLGNITTLSVTSGDVESNGIFRNCSQLEFVRIPATITSIGVSTFYKCSALLAIVCKAVVPPTLYSYALRNTNNCPIYVPDASLEAYKTATNWVSYADRIKPLSEIEGDDSRLDYIHDSMLMWLDGIDKGTVEGEWQDLVSGNTFVNHGAIAEADGWRFDGASSYMGSATLTNYGPGFGDRTFEIVAEFERENTTEVVYMGAGTGYAFGRYAAGKSILLGSDADLPSLADDMTSGVRIISVSTTAALQIVASKINGNNAQVGTKNYFVGGGDFIHLGKRSAGNHFKGIIHAIRIHDRILSEEEILYNQRIDNKRFNLGLDI